MPTSRFCGGFCLLFCILNCNVLADSRAELTTGIWKIWIAPHQPIQFTNASDPAATVADPLAADLIDLDQKIHQLAGQYDKVEAKAGHLIAKVSLQCPGGSALNFRDDFSVIADSFVLFRNVTAGHISGQDVGIRTEFQLHARTPGKLAQMQPFVPGIWYCDTQHVPPSGLISDPDQREYLFREDRLPIPMAMVRDPGTGLCISLVHLKPDGATFLNEQSTGTIIDDRMKIASLGLRQQDGISVVMTYPGVEGDQTRLAKPRERIQRAERFHPLKQAFSQSYTILIHLWQSPDFDAGMRDAWQAGFSAMSPQIMRVSMPEVYASSIDCLNHYYAEPKGIPGFPFDVSLPSGAVHAVSYQMGFVGEQIPDACHLITAGFARNRQDLLKKGENIIDFWAANTLSPQGVPRVWYDVDPKPHWRDYKTLTRIATDGMEGMLQGWRRMRLNHRDKPAWLSCCKKFGDWLVAYQNTDGSFCRQYDFDGTVLIPSKSASLHPVRFLIDLHNATGEPSYLDCAIRAGRFGVADIGTNTNYYGGTADNNDVKDKEAGWIALDSFLALYEATHDKSWLIAAEHAGTFTESWTYCWNVPMPEDDPGVTFPRIKTTAGLSLIATGHSAGDVFLAFAPYAYERLSIYTGNPHYAAVARLLLYNNRQLVDIHGSLHYGQPGLLTEAFTLSNPRGHGVNVWLPWCTAAVLDPMQQLADTFGTIDLDEIEQMPMARREAMLKAFAADHGFPKP